MIRSISFLLLLSSIGCETPQPDVNVSGQTTPYGNMPHDIPGMIEAEHFDNGPSGEAYYDNDSTNHGVDYRGSTYVDIEQRSDASNGHGIGWATAGEWLAYTVNVTQPGRYTLRFPVASDGEGGTFYLEVDGEDVTGSIRIPDTGGWDQLEVIQKENVRLEAGTHLMKLVMDTDGESGGVGDIDYIHFVKTP